MNPFDNDSGSFIVLVNASSQHSLWPVFAPVPSGWDTVHGPVDRQTALAWIDEHWRDITPLSHA